MLSSVTSSAVEPFGGFLSSCCSVGSGDSVEESHDSFDDEGVGVLSGLVGESSEGFFRHRPWIEIEARSFRGGGEESGIDVVGSDFSGGDSE